MAALLKQHASSIEDWLKVQRDGDAAANKAGNWLGDIRGIEARVKASYKAEKAPILEAERVFKAKWDPVVGLMTSVKMKSHLSQNRFLHSPKWHRSSSSPSRYLLAGRRAAR